MQEPFVSAEGSPLRPPADEFVGTVKHTIAYLRLAALELRDLADRPFQYAGAQLRHIADGLDEDAAELARHLKSGAA